MARRMPLLLALSWLVLALTACSSDGADVQPADLVLTNGRVVTVDDALPEGEALAVRGGRVVAVGSSEEIAAHVGDATDVVDLEGRLAIPGFIEGHGHFRSLGESRMILDLTTARTFDDIVAMVADAVAEAEPGAWIRGRGWHQEKWEATPEPNVDGVPWHDALSAVSPANPVVLTHASGHATLVNARALELAGIDAGTPDPAGGTIVRGPDGRATGLLRETASEGVGQARSEAEAGRTSEERDAEFRRQVELAGREALSKGVTTFHDAGVDFGTVDGYRRLADEGALPVRLYVMIRAGADELETRLEDARLDGYAGDMLTVRAIKRSIDGALGSHGAWLLEPYDDLPSSAGLETTPVEEIERTARVAVEHGFQLNVHAIGDRANREVLDAYQRAWDAAGADGDTLRWRIEHAQHLHPDDIPRFAEMGVIASMQGVHATSDGPWVEAKLGEWRSRTGAYVWRTLWDSGATVTNGTDTPVEDVSPLASYHSTVTRMTSTGSPFYPDQALTRMEALRSYTINNAWAGFMEGSLGSLTPGKHADIVVLSQDILTVPDADLPTTEVDMTILGGEIRYRRGGDR